MNYNSLIFNEIEEDRKQALIDLECDWKVRVVLDLSDGVHDCTLYNEKGGILDSEEGVMKAGVEEFITSSQELLKLHKETMADNAFIV